MHHFCYSGAMLFNLVTVSVYWSMLHTEVAAANAHKPVSLLVCYTVHIIPGAVGAINSCITDCRLSRRLSPILGAIAAVYLAFNFYAVKYLRGGEPIYSFMTW